MYLSGWVDEAHEHARTNWDGVLFVVDVGQVQVGVHVVGKCLVADTRETVTDGLEGCSGGEPKREIHRVKKRDSRTYGQWRR